MAETRLKALEMVRAIRDSIYEETKGLSREQLKAYFDRGATPSRAEVTEESRLSGAKRVVDL